MRRVRRMSEIIFLSLITLTIETHLSAQTLIATVPVGVHPQAIAVNSATNKIYVLNTCDSFPTCTSSGSVTVIDGVTLATVSVPIGIGAEVGAGIAVNQTTNKIYATNYCGNSFGCSEPGTVTVIDGATLATTTVTVGFGPTGVAINESTDKIYVVNHCGNQQGCSGNASVTVIDGTTLATTSVAIGPSTFYWYQYIALNPITNKIYVTDPCGDSNCDTNGSLTIIDGGTLNTQNVTLGLEAEPLAVNTATNKIYVANANGNLNPFVSVVDGSTLSTTSVPVGVAPADVAINQTTNYIYVSNPGSNSVTVINGATLSTQTLRLGILSAAIAVNPVTNKFFVVDADLNYVSMVDGTTLNSANLAVGQNPGAIALNQRTDKIYIANQINNTVSVIDGTPPTPLQFVSTTPCRVVDTRNPDGPFGGPPIQGGTYRSFALPQNSNCNIPANTAAYSLNVTVVPHGRLGYLTVWPTGALQPQVSTLNSDGRTKADAAIIPAGSGEAVSVYATDTTDVILDIDGYFVNANGSGLAFYPLTPCRIADTRNPNGPLGGPYLQAGVPRNFPILEAATCNIPDTAQAYSLNFTAAPHGPLGYLTVWPTGQDQPLVSTINAPTGTVTANAAVVVAGANGEVSTYAHNDTDLIIDIDGYFAAPSAGGLSLYTIVPCRLLDTRQTGGNGFTGTYGPIASYGVGTDCGVWTSALGYVFNATVVPAGSLGYLTLWPDGEQQPLVSTLNANDGAITSNMAIVPAGNLGQIDAYASGTTNLILDVSSYFAP